jgi:hypothetical protein
MEVDGGWQLLGLIKIPLILILNKYQIRGGAATFLTNTRNPPFVFKVLPDYTLLKLVVRLNLR